MGHCVTKISNWSKDFRCQPYIWNVKDFDEMKLTLPQEISFSLCKVPLHYRRS